MFEPGSIIMVAEWFSKTLGKLELHHEDNKVIALVHVAERIGPIKGKGWLIRTKEGNFCIVTGSDQYIARCCFLLDRELIRKMVIMAKHPNQNYKI
jgi:hypothetical protein